MATIFFLVKFYDNPDYADDFVRGRVFLKRLSAFKEDDAHDDARRMDPHEGTFLWGQPGKGRLTINGMDISDHLVGPIRMQKEWVNHLHVFCIHAAHSGDLDLGTISNDNIDVLRREMAIPEQCLSLGDHAVVVRDVPELVRRIKAAVEERDYRIGCGLVRYYDPESFHGQFHDIESVFRKQAAFGHQREYRFVVNTNTTGDSPLMLDLGNLSDIAVRIDSNKLNGEDWIGGMEFAEWALASALVAKGTNGLFRTADDKIPGKDENRRSFGW